MVTNCKNCGAPLVNGKCEYCRTEYDESGNVTLRVDSSVMSNIFMSSIFSPNEARRLSGLDTKLEKIEDQIWDLKKTSDHIQSSLERMVK